MCLKDMEHLRELVDCVASDLTFPVIDQRDQYDCILIIHKQYIIVLYPYKPYTYNFRGFQQTCYLRESDL